MKRLFLDFRRAPRASPAGCALLAAGLLAAGLSVAAHLDLNREAAGLDAEAERAAVQGTGASQEPLPIQGRSEKAALEHARNVVEHLTVPWDRLFGALEAIQEKQVALLSVTRNVQKRQIRIYAEAKTLPRAASASGSHLGDRADEPSPRRGSASPAGFEGRFKDAGTRVARRS